MIAQLACYSKIKGVLGYGIWMFIKQWTSWAALGGGILSKKNQKPLLVIPIDIL